MIRLFSRLYERYRSSAFFWFWLIVVACSIVMLPMPLSGLPESYDAPQHLRFAAAFRDAFLSGDFIPGWAAADNYGFGSVGVRFYPPLAGYLMGLTDIYFQSLFSSFLINAFFWIFPGCIGMYLWARESLTREQAGIAALLYAVMPYHLLQIYQYTLFSEFAASSVLPFCFWFATRVMRNGRAIDVLLFGVSYSLLILTHLPTVITGSIALAAYTFVLVDWRNFLSNALRFSMALGLSLAATSFYWLRVVTEMEWLKHNTDENWSNWYDFGNFLFPIFVNMPEKAYWDRVLWILDISSIFTYLLFLPLAFCVIFYIRKSEASVANRKFALGILVSGAVLLFLTTTPSKFVWESLPALHKIQFPWRFLSPLSVIGALAFAISLPLLYRHFSHNKRLILYPTLALIFGLLLFNVTENIASMVPNSREAFEAKYPDLNNMEGCDCWWPVWGKRGAFNEKTKVLTSDRKIEVSSWDREDRSFSIEAGDAQTARIATFWYPHWRADINGSPVEVGRDENGAILIPVPAERSDVRLYFEEPEFLEVAKYVSIATWLVFLALFVGLLIKRKQVSGKTRLGLISNQRCGGAY